ncbi:hypothetical protein ANN_12546 [Periplaneta americana]|uniref:Endonuclease/exonuclease/phosphatase domain-containing protein n=1 Tax=Periplaneta americana TaxID=6978 RepID=A0ABQ8TIU7_PERAM|nr:hypothetical protein ANN_12546 [Periplaneta americana]
MKTTCSALALDWVEGEKEGKVLSEYMFHIPNSKGGGDGGGGGGGSGRLRFANRPFVDPCRPYPPEPPCSIFSLAFLFSFYPVQVYQLLQSNSNGHKHGWATRAHKVLKNLEREKDRRSQPQQLQVVCSFAAKAVHWQGHSGGSCSRGQPIRGGPPAWRLGEGLTTHHRKKQLVTNPYNKPRNRTDSLARPQQRNKVLRFGTWNVTSLYRTGGVTLVAKELARYRIDFVGVQEVRLDRNGTSQIGDYLLYYGEGNINHQLGTGFFVHKRIKSAVKKVEFISDRLSYLVLKGRWCDIVVKNAHAHTEEKDDHMKNSFYEKLEHSLDHLPRYHMKVLLRDFNAKVGREDIFKPTIGKESLHISSNDNGVRRLRWTGHVARMGESRNAYRVLVGRPEGERPLGRTRRRWEDNIKMDLREVGYDGRDWINLAQDRDKWRAYVRAAMNLRVP